MTTKSRTTKHKTKIGRIYKKWRVLADGSRSEQATWTVRYKHKDYATGETDPKKAEKFLLRLASQIADGVVEPKLKQPEGVVLVSQIFDTLHANGRKKDLATAREREGQVNLHLLPFFGAMDAGSLTTEDIDRYIDERLASQPKPKPATINKELAALKRALNLAKKSTPPKIKHFPTIEMLKVSNTRKGFLKPVQYAALKATLPDYLRPVFITGYYFGARREEILQLEIKDVELDGDTPQFRLYEEATKNGDGRVIPLARGEMLDTLKAQIEMTRRDFPGCPWVFHNQGERMFTFYKAWESAVAGADGVPDDLLFHDLRRTAVRNMIRAGIPRGIARAISGHKTEAVFERYNITDETDLRTAAAAMAAFNQVA